MNEKKVRDEDKMITKLNEHKNMGTCIKYIAESENIKLDYTFGNDPRGDLEYSVTDELKLIEAIDKYFGEYKK